MDQVAAMLRVHRRTLDRHLQKHGVQFGELLESVKNDIARQLLRDTDLQVQQIAETLHFSSAANFATSFRRWAAMTPREVAVKSLRVPPKLPNPVRDPDRKRTSDCWPCVFIVVPFMKEGRSRPERWPGPTPRSRKTVSRR